MRLFRHYTEVPVEARGSVVALGNFDGVHCGHQAVIKDAARIARELGAPLAVLTFEPHPREFFQPDQPSFRLTPLRIKVRVLDALGVDHLFVLHFDAELARKSAEAFVAEVLGDGLQAAHIVVGYDFVFGHKRRGDVALLRRLAGTRGVGVTAVEPAVSEGGEVFSSTRIRELLRAGDPARASLLLGRPWEIEGRVEPGDARGRLLGFPTANVSLHDYLQPALGVYAVRAGIDEGQGTVWRDGVANIGRRPTVGGEQVRLEVHLLDFTGDLYGRHLRVALIEFLRGEKKFDGLDGLKAQIAADSARACELLAAYAGPAAGALPQPPAADDRLIGAGVGDEPLRPRRKSRS